MENGKNGWQSKNITNFYTTEGGTYDGDNLYIGDNSTSTPTLLFCLYHSQNLSIQQDLGTVTIRFQVLEPVDDLTYEISYIDIEIDLSTALFQDDYYEAAISPGEEFNLFTTTETNITEDSIFSTYYSLLINDFNNSDYAEKYETCSRVIVSRTSSNLPYVFRENTRITMLDMATNKYYYYIVTAEDEASNKYIYNLDEFIEMGSTNAFYEESNAYNLYYNNSQNLIYENFIFHVDFRESNITESNIKNSLLMELQDENGQTLIGVLGIQRETTVYSIYTNKNANIEVTALGENNIYLGNPINLNITTNYTQSVIDSKTIYDTKYFNSKMGLKISIFDNNDNQLNLDSLFGVNFIYNGDTYYPRIDGSVRIKIADRVSNVLARIKINTEHNTTLATGTYKIKIEAFGSPDGVYYGTEDTDVTEHEIIIINGTYGLKVTTDDNSKIVDKTTGKTLHGNNSLITNVEYSSALSNPRIMMELQRRDYTTEYSFEYIKVDLADYLTNRLTAGVKELEYLAIDGPAQTNQLFLMLKENLTTGTYKIVFKLYDENNYIGEDYEYFIIK